MALDEFEKKIKAVIDFRYAKGWEYWTKKNKKHNLNLTEEELHNKIEEYVDRHKDTNFAIDSLIEKGFKEANK